MDQRLSNRPVLEVRGLTKRFGGLTAVKNLGFDVNAGEIFGLIGPNGSGKSTAMKSVMGIERPTAGDVIFEQQGVVHTAKSTGSVPAVVLTASLLATDQPFMTMTNDEGTPTP